MAGGTRASATNAIHHPNSAADPPHHWHRHRVSNRAVPRTIRGGLPAIWDQRVIVRHPLQPLALTRGQPPDGERPADREQWCAVAPARTAGLRFERRHNSRWTAPPVARNATLEAHRDL